MERDAGLLGAAIREARLAKHLSQEALAENAGITPTHIKHIESGHRKPSVETLYKLVRTLNLSVDDVFFPEQKEGTELRRAIERMLRDSDEWQLRLILALLETMLGFGKPGEA